MELNKEKQIEEMAKDIYSMLRSDAMSRALASVLYTNGWHKDSEVARELFSEFDSLINLVCAMTGLNIIAFGKYAELKKKYLEGKEND